MGWFNALTTMVFDPLLGLLGHGWWMWFDLILWSVLCGMVALVVYRFTSNQKGIEAAKERIKMHLLEIRLYRHDVVTVLKATAKILFRNAIYVGHNLVPGVILAIPMLTVLAQLEANYAFVPAEVGTVELLKVQLRDDTDVRPVDVTLTLPDGVALDAPPVRTPDGEIFWRLRAEEAGDHVLVLEADGHRVEKGWAVGGDARKVPLMRTRSWMALLYPNEPVMPADAPFWSAELAYPARTIWFFPDGELGVLLIFFGVSLVAGYAMKDLFGVTL